MRKSPSRGKRFRQDAKAKRPRRKASGGGNGNAWFYVVLAALLGGLLWVAWPYFYSPSPATSKRAADPAVQLREITGNPDAEVLNPEGEGSKKN